jgi:hypothetical protein
VIIEEPKGDWLLSVSREKNLVFEGDTNEATVGEDVRRVHFGKEGHERGTSLIANSDGGLENSSSGGGIVGISSSSSMAALLHAGVGGEVRRGGAAELSERSIEGGPRRLRAGSCR